MIHAIMHESQRNEYGISGNNPYYLEGSRPAFSFAPEEQNEVQHRGVKLQAEEPQGAWAAAVWGRRGQRRTMATLAVMQLFHLQLGLWIALLPSLRTYL